MGVVAPGEKKIGLNNQAAWSVQKYLNVSRNVAFFWKILFVKGGDIKISAVLGISLLFVFLALQPIVVVFSQLGSGL